MKTALFRKPSLALAAGLAGAALTTCGVATAAGGGVSLKLKGDYRQHRAVACHVGHNYRYFHRSATVEYKGVLTPAPALHFPVRLELKRCSGGHWVDAGNRYTRGKKATGRYKGFFRAAPLAARLNRHHRRPTVYYFARSNAGGARSQKVYFAVTG